MSSTIEIRHLVTASGSDAPNQLIHQIGEYHVFISYGEIIAINTRTTTFVNRDLWDYSQTTLRYLKQFLGTSRTKAQLAKVFENLSEFELCSNDFMKDMYRTLYGLVS